MSSWLVRWVLKELTKKFLKTTVAIWLVILFLECSFVQLFKAEGANKVLRMKLSKHCGNTSARYWFVTSSTKSASFSMVMGLTVRLTFVVEKRPPLEWLSTIPTHKTLWMPLGVQRCDVIVRDGLAAPTAFRGKQGQVVRPAVWFSILLMESLLTKLLTAVGTEKMFWMPVGVQGSDTFIQDGSVAIGTPG